MKEMLKSIVFILTFMLVTNEKIHSECSKYYDQINTAEMAICEQDFMRADSIYREAFKNVDCTKIIDKYNALMVLTELGGNYIRNDEIMEYLKFFTIDGGMPLAFFETNEDFNIFKSDTTLWVSFLNNYPDWRSTFIDSADFDFLYRLNLLADQDQALRTYDYFSYQPYRPNDLKYFHLLSELIDQREWPSNRSIGISNSPEKTRSYLAMIPHPFFINILHAAQGKDEHLKNVFIPKWYSTGDMEPEYISYLLCRYNDPVPIEGGLSMPTFFIQDDTGIYEPIFKEEQEHNIDSLRATYNLCPISDHREKLVFQMNYPKFILVPHGGISRIPGVDTIISLLVKNGVLKKLELIKSE